MINDAAAYCIASRSCAAAMWSGQRGCARRREPAGERGAEKAFIDLIARDIPDLLAQIDGREVLIGNRTVKLRHKGSPSSASIRTGAPSCYRSLPIPRLPTGFY